MVATFALLVLTTLAPSNLYDFSDVSLKYSLVLMTSFSNLLKVVWTENPLLDLLKVVWNGKPLLYFLKVAWTGMMPGSHSDLACYLALHVITLLQSNHLNGWTLTEKQTRKRKRKDQPPKKPKKPKPAVKKSAKKKS